MRTAPRACEERCTAASRQTLHVLRHPKAPRACGTRRLDRRFICDIALVPARDTAVRAAATGTALASAAPTARRPRRRCVNSSSVPATEADLKPWQGAPITIAGAIDVDASDRHRRPFADETRAAPALGPALDADAARDELAKTKNDVRRARDEVEEWKKLYTDLKSLVDRKLVDAE